MGRKSKLTDAQWAEIERRMLVGGSTRALAKEFGVGEATLRGRKSAQVAEIKSVANQIVTTERALQALPISAQIHAQNHASRLRALSDNLLNAASLGAATSHRLAAIANAEVQKLDDSNPFEPKSLEALRGVAVLTKLANDSAAPGLNILAASKDAIKAANEGEAADPAEFLAELASLLPN